MAVGVCLPLQVPGSIQTTNDMLRFVQEVDVSYHDPLLRLGTALHLDGANGGQLQSLLRQCGSGDRSQTHAPGSRRELFVLHEDKVHE